jgi:hypothetical protein
MPKADNNVPFIGPRARYNIVGVKPTWIVQKMKAGSTFNKARPATATKTADQLDPVVSAGLVKWEELTSGGLFDLLANRKEAVVVEKTVAVGSPTVDIVALDGTTKLRDVVITSSFILSPGEMLRTDGGTELRLQVRIYGEKVL